MTDASHTAALDAAIEAASALAGLTICEAHRDGVRLHLSNGLAIADTIGPVPDVAAPVFRP